MRANNTGSFLKFTRSLQRRMLRVLPWEVQELQTKLNMQRANKTGSIYCATQYFDLVFVNWSSTYNHEILINTAAKISINSLSSSSILAPPTVQHGLLISSEMPQIPLPQCEVWTYEHIALTSAHITFQMIIHSTALLILFTYGFNSFSVTHTFFSTNDTFRPAV